MKHTTSNLRSRVVPLSSLAFSGAVVSLTGADEANAQSTNEANVLDETVVEADRVEDEEEVLYKPENLTSPKFQQPVAEIPQTLTVIPEEVIREQNADSLSDILRNVPGISLQAGEGGAAPGDSLTMRGFASRNDIFVDGVRDLGNYNRDPFNVEQVEVAKGPSSSNTGRGSTGGSINLATKKAQLDDFTRLNLGIGTDEYYRGTIDLNGQIQALPGAAFRLNGLYHSADTPGRGGPFEERWGIAPTVSFGLDSPTRIHLSYQYYGEDNLPDFGVPRQVLNDEQYYDNFYGLNFRDYEEISSHSASLEVEHDFSETFKVRNLSRFQTTNIDLSVTAPRFVTGSETLVRRTDWKDRDQTDSNFVNQTDFNIEFDTGSIRHQVSAGVEFGLEWHENTDRADGNLSLAPETPLADPDPSDTYDTDIYETGADREGEGTSYALYLFDRIQLNEQWAIDAGLRWDRYDLDLISSDLETSTDGFSYRIAATYSPVENGMFYAGYSTSFDPASATAASSVSSRTPAENLELDPEESWTAEIGTKWELFDERALLSFAAFHTEKQNAQTVDPVTDLLVLEGNRTVQGFEVGLSGELTDWWRVNAAYTYLNSSIDESNDETEEGNVLANSPEHSFSVWNVFEFDRFSAGIGTSFIGERYSNDSNDADRLVESYMLWDSMLAYQVSDSFALQLNVNNIFDARYIDKVGGGHMIPGEGRSAVLSASYEF
ncbi:MAG: TonB-dependent siderophore receptor [Verrucomicrobiota bacterium JB023]|nr:TonB-dependent siderophore receptor [Verrucomicrobiota bacterium JB023]